MENGRDEYIVLIANTWMIKKENLRSYEKMKKDDEVKRMSEEMREACLR